MKFSVYIVCLSVFSLSNLKLHKTLAAENIFIQEKSMLRLTFNPGLALTGFRTTRRRTLFIIYLTLVKYQDFSLLLENNIFIVCSEDTIFIFHV